MAAETRQPPGPLSPPNSKPNHRPPTPPHGVRGDLSPPRGHEHVRAARLRTRSIRRRARAFLYTRALPVHTLRARETHSMRRPKRGS